MVTVSSSHVQRKQGKQRNQCTQTGVLILVLLVIALFLTLAALIWRGALLSHLFLTGDGSSSNNNPIIRKKAISRLPIKASKHNRHNMGKKWPPLGNVYDGKKVISDPQYLLDFAILGFEKSGTSTLMKWLGGHPEVQCFQEEIYDLYTNRIGTFVWRLSTQMEPGYQYKRGYKSPVDIFNANAMHLLDQYFPKARILLALRHPVLYYESLFNFRIQNLPINDEFIKPLDGIGECNEKSLGVCTDHANFGQWMYRMGKTVSDFPTATEEELLKTKSQVYRNKAKVTRNPVFLMELSQFIDQDVDRKNQFKRDLQTFLGLTQDLDENVHAIPGKKWAPDVQASKDALKMNICQEQYIPLRKELMRVSRVSSRWIRESFLMSDDVFVSSPEFFEQAMIKWMDDPCDSRASSKNSR